MQYEITPQQARMAAAAAHAAAMAVRYVSRRLQLGPRAHLMGNVAQFREPVKPAHAQERFEAAKKRLGRDPVVLFHPWDPSIIVYVEGEPDDWRDQIAKPAEVQ